jgi:aminopeptidase N
MLDAAGADPVRKSAGRRGVGSSRQEARMHRRGGRRNLVLSLLAVAALSVSAFAPRLAAPEPQRRGGPPPEPTRADFLRGEYGRHRANNDLLYYHLDIRVDPATKLVNGKNTIRFRMLADDTRIQIDLYANLNVDRIVMGEAPLKYERELNAVFIDFPETLRAGREYAIDFHYSGTPQQSGRFGGFVFQTAEQGRTWIYTACEGQGSSIWWPSKDQWRDEPESMDISVAVPSHLTDVSNGRFLGKTDLGDGFTRWDWRVHHPINSYNVSINVTDYAHFSDTLGELTLDFYVTPENLDKAKVQFAQAKPMMEAFQQYFGEYPFVKDGYKLIEVPYSGMEHQSAVTYGNRFANGYLERDWTGVGVSLKFDFIIVHESAHEWFGNAVSAADVSDMWIQEGWATYLEGMYVEALFGYDDALKYVNGYKARVQNRTPIITRRGIHRSPPQDMYFKGALFLHTLRSVVNDDSRWWALVRDVYQHFKYRNIMTEDLVAFMNARTGMNLTPIFDQYLRHTALPVLELRFNPAGGSVDYRWQADVEGLAMPVRVGAPDAWQTVTPTAEWQTMRTALAPESFAVATDLYYIEVARIPQ